MKLATIGYEAATLASVIAALKDARVEKVIDVRAIAASRRAGFSKTILAASLAQAGIGYVHLRQLGTPKPGRDAARAGRIAEMHKIFNAHLEQPAAQLELLHAGEIAAKEKSALLCFEADACRCHREIVAGLLHDAHGFKVEHLVPARSAPSAPE